MAASIFRNNKEKSRYELEIDGYVAFANYHEKDEKFYIDYVFAPGELRGTGAAGQLMKEMMKELKSKDVKIVPICRYAASWLKRHDEYQSMLA